MPCRNYIAHGVIFVSVVFILLVVFGGSVANISYTSFPVVVDDQNATLVLETMRYCWSFDDVTNSDQNQTTPSGNQTTPNNNQTTPNNNHTTPNNNHTTPNNNHTTSSSNRRSTSSNPRTTRINRRTTRINRGTTSSNQTTPSSNKTTTGSNHTTPNSNQTTPSNQTTNSSNQTTTNSSQTCSGASFSYALNDTFASQVQMSGFTRVFIGSYGVLALAVGSLVVTLCGSHHGKTAAAIGAAVAILTSILEAAFAIKGRTQDDSGAQNLGPATWLTASAGVLLLLSIVFASCLNAEPEQEVITEVPPDPLDAAASHVVDKAGQYLAQATAAKMAAQQVPVEEPANTGGCCCIQ